MRAFIAFLLMLIAYSISFAEDLPYHKIDHPESSPINAIAWKPDESLLAVSGDGGVWFYNDDGQEVASLDSETVTDLAWSPDAETLAVSTSDHKIAFWRYQAGELTLEKTIQTEGDRINSLAFSPDEKYIAAISSDETEYYSDGYRIFHRLRIYEIATEALIFTSEPTGGMLSHRYALNMIQWSADGQRLLTFGGLYRNLVVMYDTHTWDILASEEHGDEIMTMSADPTLTTLFSTEGNLGNYDDGFGHRLKIYNLNETPFKPSAYQEIRAWITALAWYPGRQLLASGDESGDIGIWRLKNDYTVEPVSTLRAHLAPVRLLAWDNSSAKLASVSQDNTVLIWHDVEQDYTPPGFYPTHTIPLPDSAQTFTWSGDGKWLVVGGENELVFYDAASRTQIASIPAQIEGEIEKLQFSEDGTRLLISTNETILVMAVAVEDSKIALNLIASHEPEPYFSSAALSVDGRVVAYSYGYWTGGPAPIRLWYFETDEIRDLDTDYPHNFHWSPDGTMLLVGLETMPRAWFHDIATDELLIDIWGIRPSCCGSFFSPRSLDWQGNLVAIGTWGQIGIWQVEYSEDGLNLTDKIKLSRKVGPIKLSRDGKLLAGVGDDGNLYVWDTATGQPLRTLLAEVNDKVIFTQVYEIAWSPDGRTLASFDPYLDSDEKQLFLWEIDPNMASSIP